MIQLIVQVSDLRRLLEDTFHYMVKRVLLKNDPQHNPRQQLKHHIDDFIWNEDDPNSLLLVYYAGHGRPKPKRGKKHEGLTLTWSGNC